MTSRDPRELQGPQQIQPPLPPSNFNRDDLLQWLKERTISAQKLITGSLQAEHTISSSNFVSGSAGWQIDGDGNAEFQNVTVRGDVDADSITAGTIRGETINLGGGVNGSIVIKTDDGDTSIESDNFSSGSAGWRIQRQGDAEFNDVTVRGDLLGNWDGADPANLSVNPDSTASTGFYFDASVGRFQLVSHAWANEWRVYNPGTSSDPGGLREISGRPQLVAYDGNDLELLTAIGGDILLNPGTSQQVHLGNDGAASSPVLAFASDNDTGIYRAGGNDMRASAGGGDVMRWQGGATPFVESTAINNLTTGAAANVNVGAVGSQLRRSTSSLKYKPDWRFINPVDVRLPDPITWVDEKGQVRIGFGAEHVHKAVPEAFEIEYYDPRSLVAILSVQVAELRRWSLLRRAWRFVRNLFAEPEVA